MAFSTRLRPAGGSAPRSGDGAMSLVDHLRELRNRLFKSILAVIPGAAVGFIFYKPITSFLIEPACSPEREAAGECQVVVSGLVAPLNLNLTVAITIGLLIAAPVWLYQLWAFVTPGLMHNERRWTLVFLGTSVPLFFFGAALCWWTFPHAVEVLQALTPDDTTNLIDVPQYLGILVRLLLVFGLGFELPVFVVLLNFVGILPARRIIGSWRWIILGCAVFGAVATPTGDPFTMLAVAVPMVLLVGVAYVVAAVHDRRKAARAGLESFGDLDDDVTSPLDARPSRMDDLDSTPTRTVDDLPSPPPAPPTREDPPRPRWDDLD